MSVETVHQKNAWYRDRYSFVLWLCAGLLLALLISISLNVFQLLHKPQPQYFAVSPDGTVTKLVPVNQPLLTPDALTQWAAETARKAYALDFVNYREQMSGLRTRFSDTAYRAYVAQMQSSGNIDAITKSRLIMDAQARPATIVRSGVGTNGRYAWEVQVPLTVVTHVGGASQRTQQVVVQMTIERVDNRFRPDSGVVVNKFLARIT